MVTVLGFCSPQRAASQPDHVRSPAASAAQRAEESNKIWQEKNRRLENQVRSLQREVVMLRAEVDRLRDVNVTTVQLAEEELPPPACDVPYAVDEDGIEQELTIAQVAATVDPGELLIERGRGSDRRPDDGEHHDDEQGEAVKE